MSSNPVVLTAGKVLDVMDARQKRASAELGMPELEKALQPRPRLSNRALRQMFRLLTSSEADKLPLLKALFRDIGPRLAAVGRRHGVDRPARFFGFPNDAAFVAYLESWVLAMKTDHSTAEDFVRGAQGRKWDFIGKALFERCVKQGAFRRYLDSLSEDALAVVNRELMTGVRGKPYRMRDALGNAVPVRKVFDQSCSCLGFRVDTPDGPKEFLDFGLLAANADKDLALPLPVEIKQPRAMGKAPQQFAEFMPRLQDAIANGREVTGLFDPADRGTLVKMFGAQALEDVDVKGQAMIAARIDPKRLTFFPPEVFGTMARNQLAVTPDKRVWTPAAPGEGVAREPVPDFVVGRHAGRDVTLEVSETAKPMSYYDRPDDDLGFNFWRLGVPVERAFFEGIYGAMFESGG